ncbi:hypothetical protein [Variovorax sp. PAMC 28711]|uniref:hypothetical protein n=1 Tax=Variovorax sp. PAMC 28711 TaxID=1795631 RepID=UPI00078B268A|nr:hypothetical protein [Variovorax sp. PAMC 28711]AMM23296.1 hypothetical protein AX767_02105 [Variovorax sp. PAMC 28711]
MAPDALPDLAALPDGAFDGPKAFDTNLRIALAAAAHHNWREIVLSDPAFTDWPLGERATLEALQAWSRSGRSFILLAQRFDVFERGHARFVQWRQTWSHIVECRVCNAAGAPPVPSAIWTPSWFMHRVDPERGRGVCGRDPERRAALRERIDECIRQGRPGFPASTLGL